MAENDLLKRLLDAGMTFTALTQSRAEDLIRDLVRAGAVQAEQAQASVDELVERSRRNSERLIDAVRAEIEQQLAKLDLASRDDLERLVQRFADVAVTVFGQAVPGRGGVTTPASAPAATPTAARAPSASAKKSPAKKAAAPRKAAGRKAAGKKSPAKKAAAPKKAAGKKAAGKKAAGKKAGPSSSASTR